MDYSVSPKSFEVVVKLFQTFQFTTRFVSTLPYYHIIFILAAFVDVCLKSSSELPISIQPGNIAVSAEVLHYLDLQQGMLIKIESAYEEPAPIPGVILNVLEKKVTFDFFIIFCFRKVKKDTKYGVKYFITKTNTILKQI